MFAIKGGMVQGLTPRQEQVLEFIRESLRANGYPPTVREICTGLHLSSPSTVHAHLANLERRGLIKRDPTKPRALDVVQDLRPRRPLPLVGRVAAGQPILADENIEEYVDVPAFLRRDDDDFVLRVRGDSMVDAGIFEGATINTPSLLCVEDALDALAWADTVGGFAGMKARSEANLKALEDWVAVTPWVEFLAGDKAGRSNTSVCLKVVDPAITALSEEAQADFAKKLASLLEKEKAAYDIGGYAKAPPGLRIWCGATVDTADVQALTPWLDWAFASVSAELAAA